MAMNDPLHRGHPHSPPLEILRSVQPLEHSKELVGILHVETGPVVPHKIDASIRRVCSATTADLNSSDFALAGELEGIGEQVDIDLAQQRRIGLAGRQI